MALYLLQFFINIFLTRKIKFCAVFLFGCLTSIFLQSVRLGTSPFWFEHSYFQLKLHWALFAQVNDRIVQRCVGIHTYYIEMCVQIVIYPQPQQPEGWKAGSLCPCKSRCSLHYLRYDKAKLCIFKQNFVFAFPMFILMNVVEFSKCFPRGGNVIEKNHRNKQDKALPSINTRSRAWDFFHTCSPTTLCINCCLKR